MSRAVLPLGLLLVVSCCLAAEIVTIDDFGYDGVAAVRAAWKESQGAPPAELMPHGNKQAMKLPCTFTKPDMPRACYDREVNLDLSRAGAITFDFYCDDPGPISYCAIYFHSGGGWYATSFSPEKGWQHLSIGKGVFRTEDSPAGWSKIDTIRISAWKIKALDTYCGFGNLQTRTEDIAVISGAAAGAEGQAVQRVVEDFTDVLDKTGVPYGVLTDADVEGGALAGKKLAIFAYSPAMSAEVVKQTQEYLAGGGKIIAFYSIPQALAESLGAGGITYKRPVTDGELAEVAFAGDSGVPGLPPSMRQDSWNIHSFTPAGHNARVIGTWRSKDGKLGDPAVLLSDTGAYMGHVLTSADPAAKQAFVMAMVGHFVPSAWETAAAGALEKAQLVGPFASRRDLDTYLTIACRGKAFAEKVKASQATAAAAEAAAKQLLADKRYAEVLGEARKLHEALAEAYFTAHTPRTAEFRAVWNHSGTGDCGSWDEAVRRLKAANFNAVVPNMWWGGVAHYDSKLLPHSETFSKQGDQIAQCVAAGKKYGIEVHPWKVNWNLSNAPKSFIDQMRAEQRLQANQKGEETAWLCPSNPKNFELERDTMLEVLRYDVDGIHFDYIRYPGEEGCYCAGCRERFEAGRGAKVQNWPMDCYNGALKAEYRDFRCAQINRLVQAVAEEAHRLKPWIRVSAAVFSDYPNCRSSVGQDWMLWCKQGWLDFVCPMNYSETDARFRGMVSNQIALLGNAIPLYSGIGAFINPDDETVGQMEMARDLGADGFILFNMGTALAQEGFPRFAEGITKEAAILPHNGPRVKFTSPYDDKAMPANLSALPVQVTLVDLGRHRTPATGISGHLELQDMSGKRLADLGELPGAGKSVTVQLAGQKAAVRLAAVGELAFAEGKKPFVVRSRPYRFGAE